MVNESSSNLILEIVLRTLPFCKASLVRIEINTLSSSAANVKVVAMIFELSELSKIIFCFATQMTNFLLAHTSTPYTSPSTDPYIPTTSL